jgi:GH15 family glucan-1,4-alpha-glucosidase
MGHIGLGLAKHMLQFATLTQNREGVWLHRHHIDYSLASSWGLHQIGETGIYLHAIAVYIKLNGDKAFVHESWDGMVKAAHFLFEARDKIELFKSLTFSY